MFENLGRALALIRDLRGKTQGAVALAAGIGKSQLSKYEIGRELPKLESLGKVLKVLGIGPFEFFYTMHVLDREQEKLRSPRQAKQPLPPPVLAANGLFSEAMDEAFQRVLRDVVALYHHTLREKLLIAERGRKAE